ncbi:serine/threonine-protein kinase [Schlesneria sp. T3-172]|uniref:serine/threonine-protein kinase n=1 Tax=Schlesneria sphaerica TaxID=3373610 RepID=UPI0037CC0094
MAEPEHDEVSHPADANENAPSSDSSSVLPRQLGEFKLLRKLGKGGMAEVYLAEQTSLRRQVAVKILLPEFVTDERYVQRFRHEAAAAGTLNHPNIVQVYMVGEDQGVNFIAQEYVQGRTLKDYINRKGAMETKVALHILRQVASALLVASENGIVHRDIKPENILLTSKLEAKVADFGLAQLTLQGERLSLTQPGMTLGTPLYMSPEQVNGQPLDSRSDIYSFGIMAWHMLVGKPPFRGETAISVAMKHLNDKAPSLSATRADLPFQLQELIEKLISKKKEDRPPSFRLVVNELKQIIRQLSGREEPTVALKSPSKPPLIFDRPIRKQLGWLTFLCLIAMAISSGVGWSMRTPDLLLVESTGDVRNQAMQTADAQLYWAMSNPHDERAWVTLKTFPGVSDEMIARANAALGLIYLKSNRMALAQTTFNDLASQSGYKANGLVGQALYAKLTGDTQLARTLVTQIDEDQPKLFPEISGALNDLRKRLDAAK